MDKAIVEDDNDAKMEEKQLKIRPEIEENVGGPVLLERQLKPFLKCFDAKLWRINDH